MREIKFRAWDKNNKRMLFQNIDFGYVGITADGIPFIDLLKIDSIDKGINPIWQTEVMQCTGIKDKNGKEIYEGDIIEYKTVYEWDKKLIKRAEVVFENGMFSPTGVIMDLSRSKIIGNIYENPELAK